MLTLWFDGLYRGIPGSENGQPAPRAGFMCYGWLILRRGKLIAQGHGTFAHRKKASSGLAEYLALVEGLEALLDLDIEGVSVEICGDARSIIDQMRGAADVNAPAVKPLHRRAKRLASRLKRVSWTWVPRRENHAADLLSRRAMHLFKQDRSIYQETLAALQAKTGAQRKAGQLMPVASVCVYL